MIFKIITLFPDFFQSPLASGLMGKACAKGIITPECIDLRQYSDDRFRRCDDYPFGGGSGMVLKADPLCKAIDAVTSDTTKVIMTSPGGILLNQKTIKELSTHDELCIICGHYEGIDQRVIDSRVDYEISIGDYVLSGGEYAALVIIDALARLIPGFMSNAESIKDESFEQDLLEYPQYTRPANYNGMKVPDVLLEGNHKNITNWRLEQSLLKTKNQRPDLYSQYILRKILGE